MTEMTKGTVVVTGGSAGIGLNICQNLLAKGYQIINLSRRISKEKNARLIDIEIDLSDPSATQQVAVEIATKYKVGGFVHNAGVIRAALLEDVQLNDLNYLTQLHIGAAITLTQSFIPGMKKNKFGRIVLITSRAALGLQTRTCYSATKAGMMGMIRTWALELGQYGITVNSVAPGPIEATEMFHDVMPEGDPRIKKLADSIPVKRIGLPQDVTHAVEFFMAPESSFITGQTLMVCGGASLGSLSL